MNLGAVQPVCVSHPCGLATLPLHHLTHLADEPNKFFCNARVAANNIQLRRRSRSAMDPVEVG
jgi:hypothetical protein